VGIVKLGKRLTDSGHEDCSIPLPRRFPPEIISYAVWVYHRFCMSFRDVEDLLAERGIIVSFEAIRQWCRKFGPGYAQRLKRKQGRLGDIWYLDELFVTASSNISGVPLIRTETLSIFCYNLAAISTQPSDSFADWCAVKARSHSEWSPTNSRATVRRSEQSCRV
jgi:hypothetical protein